MKMAKMAWLFLLPLALLSCGTDDTQATTQTQSSERHGVLAMLGTITRCAVANRGNEGVLLKKIHFVHVCNGVQQVASRQLAIFLQPHQVQNIDVVVSPTCRTVEPLYCAVDE